ncbi:MAG: lysine-sensitive aspartokinase 3 [Candidatus Eisenbacteria bacterium]|nr:lysine-sensitive aspartokinase 3 [Candidatus Eisenbacteria bacterium]
MIVFKFGGTSVEDAAAIRRAATIVAGRRSPNAVIVVSAMAGMTNALVEAAADARAGRLTRALEILDRMIGRHRSAADDLAGGHLRQALDARLDEARLEAAETLRSLAEMLEGDPSAGSELPTAARLTDSLLAQGEILSSHLTTCGFSAAGLPTRFLDIRPMMRTNADFGRAAVDLGVAGPRLAAGFRPEPGDDRIVVTQGFIGSTIGGATTTIGRGGSDLTASILGAALDATEVQIWTDVDGIMTTDPRVVPGALHIEVISFAEAAELAYFGAKVLHPSTLAPAMTKNIPVRVLNSRRPDGVGTAIVRSTPGAKGPITAIAFKRGITVLNVTSDRMLMAHGFLARLFEVFSRHETAVDMVTTSEVSVSMTLDDTRHLPVIRNELAPLGDVSVETDQAIVCLVGEGLRSSPGLVPRIFSAVQSLPVSMISHGASAINLSFVTPGSRVEEAVRALHAEFWGAAVPQTAPGQLSSNAKKIR